MVNFTDRNKENEISLWPECITNCLIPHVFLVQDVYIGKYSSNL
jgi:hypothetical protein